ncbi:PIR Superfamily Protein [Plasmodium ovale curtisi]|uniref:PIR Superfamily Protein n=1 Tax=Plasmodium ovale curtisi TaxID=864141 RepID=A0A1A8X930_PLAOA|nr:PIR Superfamily Protein [Plasmodium ovale curtisi]SBT00774.1 PIR Superfamily Protein [Plasmodium ovale curtisi]
MSDTKSDIYSFFKEFEEYKECEGAMNHALSGNEHDMECDSFSSGVQKFGTERANDVCVKFKILCKVIQSKKKGPEPKILDQKDYAYLNYWLNSKLRNGNTSHDLTVDQFQKEMSDRELQFVNVKFDKKLYDIKDEDFNNMILLSDLYDNIAQIFYDTSALKDKKISCIKYFQKYINTYKQGIIKCPHDDTSFCKALKHIKGDYEQKFLGVDSISEKCIDRENLLLPAYEDVSLERKNTIVGSILGPSFATLFTSFFLYKFTPLGNWILNKMGTKNGTHSNIYEENDQSILNTSDINYINSDYNEYGISYDSVVNF